ncbi:11540_t:CDS:2 [Ambispora gerdemannii]|uniref:11540_t:CDS:1 n=1 Tax=Ambispora gerdemannii TaxID=144530 RepID=A0A9N9BGE9_9GLOM|nr:11540_t:CDS:2 [Ambispora gerdemannii]
MGQTPTISTIPTPAKSSGFITSKTATPTRTSSDPTSTPLEDITNIPSMIASSASVAGTSSNNTPTIVTAIVLGIIGFLLLAGFLFLCWRRRKYRRYRANPTISKKPGKQQRFTLDYILGTDGYYQADSEISSIPSTPSTLASGGDTRPQSLLIQGNPHAQQSMRQISPSVRTISNRSIITPTQSRDSLHQIDFSKLDAYVSGFKEDEDSSSNQQRPPLQPQQSLESNVPDHRSQDSHSAQQSPSQSQSQSQSRQQQGSDYFNVNQSRSSSDSIITQQKSLEHTKPEIEPQREILATAAIDSPPKVSSQKSFEHNKPAVEPQREILATSAPSSQKSQKSFDHDKPAVEPQREIVTAAAIDSPPKVSNVDAIQFQPPPPQVDLPRIDTSSHYQKPQPPISPLQSNPQQFEPQHGSSSPLQFDPRSTGTSSPLQFNPQQFVPQHGTTFPLPFDPQNTGNSSPLQFNPRQFEPQHGSSSPLQFDPRSTGNSSPLQLYPPKLPSSPIQNHPQQADSSTPIKFPTPHTTSSPPPLLSQKSYPQPMSQIEFSDEDITPPTSERSLQRAGSVKRSIHRKNRDASPAKSEDSLRRSLLRNRGGSAGGSGERSRSRDSSDDGSTHNPDPSPPVVHQQSDPVSLSPPNSGTPTHGESPESFSIRSNSRSPFERDQQHQGGEN